VCDARLHRSCASVKHKNANKHITFHPAVSLVPRVQFDGTENVKQPWRGCPRTPAGGCGEWLASSLVYAGMVDTAAQGHVPIPLFSPSAAGLVLSPFDNVARAAHGGERVHEIDVSSTRLEERMPWSIEGIFFVGGESSQEECASGRRCFDNDYARSVHRIFLQFVGRPMGLTEISFPLLQLDPTNWREPFSAPFSLVTNHYTPGEGAEDEE
jgi:hypothetical protein